MVRALQRKQNSGRYVDRKISAQKREARRPSRRLVPDELDTVFDDDDNADDADVNNALDNDESNGGIDGTISEKGDNSDEDE